MLWQILLFYDVSVPNKILLMKLREKKGFYLRPYLSTRAFSISILFFIINVYFDRSSLPPAFIANFAARDVFSNLPSYMFEIGTNAPSLLHNHPWAALNAAPNEAESGTVKITCKSLLTTRNGNRIRIIFQMDGCFINNSMSSTISHVTEFW